MDRTAELPPAPAGTRPVRDVTKALAALGVPADRVYLDKGLTGTSRARPGLDQALAAVREGDTLTVTKLDRLARSVPDALDILNHLSARGVLTRNLNNSDGPEPSPQEHLVARNSHRIPAAAPPHA